jgi:hypothetical protein
MPVKNRLKGKKLTNYEEKTPKKRGSILRKF